MIMMLEDILVDPIPSARLEESYLQVSYYFDDDSSSDSDLGVIPGGRSL